MTLKEDLKEILYDNYPSYLGDGDIDFNTEKTVQALSKLFKEKMEELIDSTITTSSTKGPIEIYKQELRDQLKKEV